MSGHAMTQLGLAIAGLGALTFAWGAAVLVLANRSYHGPSEGQHRHEKVAHLVGSVFLTVGFLVQLLAVVVR